MGAAGGVYCRVGAKGKISGGPNTWKWVSQDFFGEVNLGFLGFGSGGMQTRISEFSRPSGVYGFTSKENDVGRSEGNYL